MGYDSAQGRYGKRFIGYEERSNTPGNRSNQTRVHSIKFASFNDLKRDPGRITRNYRIPLFFVLQQEFSHGILAKNWSSADACTGKWKGITCKDGRVFFIMACSAM